MDLDRDDNGKYYFLCLYGEICYWFLLCKKASMSWCRHVQIDAFDYL